MTGCPNMCHATAVHSFRWASLCPPDCYLYLSTLDALKKISRQEGVRVLWTGTRESLVMAVPLVGLYLPLYDSLHLRMAPSMGFVAPVAAGMIARTASMFCVAPIEVLRVRLQLVKGSLADNKPHISNLNAFDWGQGKGLFQKARALWRGFGATVMRDVPFTAVYWGLLEPTRRRLSRGEGEGPLSELIFANSVAGASCGVIASVASQPMDVVKTRIQIGQTSRAATTTNPWRMGQHIFQTEGWKGLFAGVGPRTLRIGPSCAIVISSYELFKKLL